MDQVTNPYTPNAGATPAALVGRDELVETFAILLARMSKGRSAKSMIVTGLRGVGKTVLLNQFRTRALKQGWLVTEIEARKNEDSEFRGEMASKLRTLMLEMSRRAKRTEALSHAMSVLKSFTLSLEPSGALTGGFRDIDFAAGFADHEDLTLDLVDVMVAVGEAAQESQRGVCILIDEIQFLGRIQLEALITALHKTVQRNLPVVLVGAGLPQIAELVGDAKSYAERLFDFPYIGELSAEDAKLAFSIPAEEEGVSYTEEALVEAIEISGGYPFFVQELGSAVWATAEFNPITAEEIRATVPQYEAKLDGSFFRVRLDRTTQLQRAYLRAMAELGSEPQKAADIAELMGRTSQNLGPIRAELINMGLLYTPEHGYAAFTVPHFDKFMLRAIPDLEVPEVKRRERRFD